MTSSARAVSRASNRFELAPRGFSARSGKTKNWKDIFGAMQASKAATAKEFLCSVADRTLICSRNAHSLG